MKTARFLLAVFVSLSFAGCSTAPIHRSAMGIMPVSSDQLIFQSIDIFGNELRASGRFYSPLNSINRVRVSRSGRTMKVKMSQAMLREDGDRRFSFQVPLSAKIDRIVVGKDAKTIWTRSEGILVDTSDQRGQTTTAASDFQQRLGRVMRALD